MRCLAMCLLAALFRLYFLLHYFRNYLCCGFDVLALILLSSCPAVIIQSPKIVFLFCYITADVNSSLRRRASLSQNDEHEVVQEDESDYDKLNGSTKGEYILHKNAKQI